MTGVATLRRHAGCDGLGLAEFSPCGTYRYRLERTWDVGPRLTFVMLNPSTADETVVDATIRVCLRRARLGGFGALRVLNLFAYRATRPAMLRHAADPVGPGNDTALAAGLADTDALHDRLVCAWGNAGHLHQRGQEVAQRLRAQGKVLHHLGLTASGAPRHPLYVPIEQPLTLWEGP